MGEVTLSQELRTTGLLRSHVLVGYQWAVENQATAGKGRPSDFVSPFDSLASETDAATA